MAEGVDVTRPPLRRGLARTKVPLPVVRRAGIRPAMTLPHTEATGEDSNELTARVSILVSAGPVCARCLAFRLARSYVEVSEALQRIDAVAALSTDVDRCGRCLREAAVHWLGRPQSDSPSRARAQRSTSAAR